jgi:hypothetical protein
VAGAGGAGLLSVHSVMASMRSVLPVDEFCGSSPMIRMLPSRPEIARSCRMPRSCCGGSGEASRGCSGDCGG